MLKVYLASDHPFEGKGNIGWPFCKPSHEVSIPIQTVWYIDAHFVTLLDQFVLSLVPHAIKHLEFELCIWDVIFLGQLFCIFDDFVIM